MKLRSPISLELVNQGYVRGTKEFKNAYNRELQKQKRSNPVYVQKEREKWKQYYMKKQKQTDGLWNLSRSKQWRQENPGDWKILAKRCSENGVHKRFYQNHLTKLREEKAAYGRKKRREKPGFGLRQSIAEFKKSSDLGKLIQKLKYEISRLN